MRRLRLLLEYDGTEFCGFQRQPEGRSVQGLLEECLSQLCGEPVQVTGAGRTDAGVHASGQVVHFDTKSRIPVERLERAANRLLSAEMAVRRVEETAPDFHARYSALRRTYDYWIHRAQPSPFVARYVTREGRLGETAAERMREAVGTLLGRWDFRPFSSEVRAGESAVRTLLEATVEEDGPLLRIRLTADGFLRSMVRTIVAALVEVGRGKWDTGRLRKAVDSGERLSGLTLAPPQGLFLARVDYPDGYAPAAGDGWTSRMTLHPGALER